MSFRIRLLAYRWKIPGLVLSALGLFLLYAYFTGHKPSWLICKVFAVASFYGERSYFSLIQTNIIDELGAILSVGGLLLLFFSRGKQEDPESGQPMRSRAMVQSLWIMAGLWALTFLLVYGFAIFFAATAFFPLYLLCCNIHYQLQVLGLRRKNAFR